MRFGDDQDAAFKRAMTASSILVMTEQLAVETNYGF
jgi:hypothetical protein